MGTAEEAEFISRFTHDATEGQICVARCVKQGVEDFFCHTVHHSTLNDVSIANEVFGVISEIWNFAIDKQVVIRGSLR